MKEIILSSGIGFGIGSFFTLCRIPIPAPNVLPGVLSIVF
ncbi:XapX domain-containing protein, partial [Salmonella enterica]|nr:XapX domain-containing protein [Salmonella enterica]